MGVAENEAWITSAVEDEVVPKAMTLASSLRRVQTTRKLVVLVSPVVSKDLRLKLEELFNSVMVLPEKDIPNGWDLEDYAKIKCLSLLVFEKCVYVSPNAVVLQNCDEIFAKYNSFAACSTGSNNEIDTSIFIFCPSQLKNFVGALDGVEVDVPRYFCDWLKNNVPMKIEELEKQYNLGRHTHRTPLSFYQTCTNGSIYNFGFFHPLDHGTISTTEEVTAVENYAISQCWKIYMENVKVSLLNETRIPLKGQYEKEPIAIVGMSLRLPGGNNVDEFWSLLADGKSGIVPLPSYRWTNENSYYPCENRKIEAGFLNIPLDEFDSKFFGLSPKEAEFLDPQQRLLLEVTWEAFEDAMIDPLKLGGTQTGVFVGSWIHDYKDMATRSKDIEFFRGYMGNSLASTAARISHFLGLTGPSIATESGCSSAIAAVDMACKYLRNGDSSVAIAGSVNLLLRPFEPKLMPFVFSPDFRCKTFDEGANGFVRAEGCAVFLLKRLSDAVKDGDNMWGIIRGTALTQEGISKSLGTPTVHCESLAMELALREAGVNPKDVSYVEAHGTGTVVGDPLEIAAIEKVYSKGRTERLLIGSVKTNVGHTEAAAGMTGMIKVLLSMKNELIPKHLNLNKLNPKLNLEAIPAEIPLESVHWPRSNVKVRIAGVSSFGISGCDGHAIIEEPPQILRPPQELHPERPLHLLKISAKSHEAMEKLIQKYLTIFKDRIERNEDSERDFADLAYSANVGRATFNHRVVITARKFTDAAKMLEARSYMKSDAHPSGGNLCFLFTGQGSQYPNMAKQLYETSPIFRDTFDRGEDALLRRCKVSIKNILWQDVGNVEEVNRTSQISIFVVEYCLFKLWESWGVKPDYVMGHSFGEFAAAVAAGCIDFEDALMLATERTKLQVIHQIPKGKMLVIKAGKETVDEAISAFKIIKPRFWVDYAALNSAQQTVVAGDSDLIEEFAKFCEGKSMKSIVLATTHAFHSRHMDPILEDYRNVAKCVKKPKCGNNLPKYISSLEGKLIDVEAIDADYWVRLTREKVRFMDACHAAQQEGCTFFLEVGPHPVLSALTMMNIVGPEITCLPSIRRNKEEWTTMLDALSKLYLSNWKGEIDWKGFDRFYKRNRVTLPFYQFNRKPTWVKFKSKRAKLHPLLGRFMPTASNDTIFENSFTLKKAPYVEDHVMGNTIIFPGAGFLEMCLAAGHSAVQAHTERLVKPKRPISLKHFQIVSPLGLEESTVCTLQTLVTCEQKNDGDELTYTAAIHRHVESKNGKGKWIQHASAKFFPMSTSTPKQLNEPIDIADIQSSWKRLDRNVDFYEKLPEIGVRFGPRVQSLECGWSSEKGHLASIKVPRDYKSYLIHPLIADAMIQAVLIWTYRDKTLKLRVPVHICEFILRKEIESAIQFVYCSNDENGENYCVLMDATGLPLALMKGLEFMETTPKLLEGLITQQSAAMPKLWKEIWKRNDGPMQGALTHETPLELLQYSQEELRQLNPLNMIPRDDLKFYANLAKRARISVLKALYILGWKPEMNQTFSVDSLIESLTIRKNYCQYIQFFLRSIARNDLPMLKVLDVEETKFKFVKSPPTKQELEETFKCVTNLSDHTRDEYKFMVGLENSLSQLLTGEQSHGNIIFLEASSNARDTQLYGQLSSLPAALKIGKHLENAERCYTDSPKVLQCRPIYRVLEVGAGIGISTKRYIETIVPKMGSTGIEYYFTDVDSKYLSPVIEKDLKQHQITLVFRKYDMEDDPLVQGLCPEYFDLILANEVFHRARNIKKTIKSVRSLLKPGGLIVINETICPDDRITFSCGLVDQYWRFEDRDFRKHHPTLLPEMWREALTEAGFHGISIIPMRNNVHGTITAFANPLENNFLTDLRPPNNSWIIFGQQDDFSEALSQKLLQVNRKCVKIPKPAEFTEISMHNYVKKALSSASTEKCRAEGVVYLWSLSPETRDQTKVSLPFVTIMKLVSELKSPPRTFAVMRGTCVIESSEVIDPTPGTLIGFCKSLSNEIFDAQLTYLDLDPSKTSMDQLNELFMNLWMEHKQGAAFRDGFRLSPKLTAGKISRNEPLTLPSGCDRFQLVLPQTRLISDLEFAYLEPYTLGDNEVEVEVKAIALNFRDVFAVLKPIPAFENFNSVGVDYGGVVVRVGGNVTRVKVGDRVFAGREDNGVSIPSHHKASENHLALLPDWMTLAEAVTFPTGFSTVILFLVRLAKLKRGETVLLHTASGGVGLVAIQVCKHYGAEMILTAGSLRKRAYLRNLGMKHVFNSRTTDFKNDVFRATGGRGVDVVLNTLTGPGFKEASLDVLKKNGRFIELSKLNVWTKQEVEALRPDVFYELVDLSDIEQDVGARLIEEVAETVKVGNLKPIPYEIFDALNIRGALNYLQKAKHIGKIVCIMPEMKLENSKLIVSTPLFNKDSTYLVTGGLGGIGFELVKWMLSTGAKHIAIASRRSPSAEVSSQIHEWNENGYHVQSFSVDVGNHDKLKAFLEDLRQSELGFPPLRGVMHAAGVLQDALFENQSWTSFSQTYHSKVNGSWNLHDLTKEYVLEHFVLFSSISATFGSPGQTNYSSSNAFEDSLAAYRNSNGLPATCVNWGNWGDVGLATEIDFPGIRPISTAQGLLALETFLTTQTSHVSVVNVDSFSMVLKQFPRIKHYVDDTRLLGNAKTYFIMNSDEFWNEVDCAVDRREKVECFKKLVKTVIRSVLKMDQDDPIDDQEDFQSMGIDSLMVLEMKNGMQNILGRRMILSANQLKDCNNTELLAGTLVSIFDGDDDDGHKFLSHDQLKQLIRDDSSNVLPRTLSVANLKKKPIGLVENVLLTGSTGNLGPYLLRDMTQRKQVKRVYCLVRPTNKLSGMERLIGKLEEIQLNGTVDVAKVEVIEGDITLPKFGLTDDLYINLSEHVDAIVHSAARTDHTATYWKAPESNRSHVRTVNVLGTARLLKFAAEKTLKHFFHASTLLACTCLGRDGKFSDQWQDVSAFDDLPFETYLGYLISKHISEQLVHQAMLKGIPCKAFRFPVIAGDSKTGRVDYKHNHPILRWLACLKIGAVHDIPAPITIIAVDHCAKITLDVFFNNEAPMDVYNVIQKSFEVEQVLVPVAHSFGIELQIISYEQFVRMLKQEEETSPIAPFIKLYVEEESKFISMFESPAIIGIQKYLEIGTTFLDSSKLAKYTPEYETLVENASEILIRDLTYLMNEGVFAKYGININPSKI